MKGFPKVLKTKEDYYNCLAMVASGELAAADLLAKIESAENQRYIECGVAAVEEEKKAVTVYYCDEAAVGMKFVAGDVSGTVQGVTHIQTDEAAAAGWESAVSNGIVPRSVWTLGHRPKCSPEGMVYLGGGTWVDIYLNSDDGAKGLKSEYGCAPMTGTESMNWYNFVERLAKSGKRLPNYAEFCAYAFGSPAGLDNANTNAWSATSNTGRGVTGSVVNAVSSVGVVDAVGRVWEWLDELITRAEHATNADYHASVAWGWDKKSPLNTGEKSYDVGNIYQYYAYSLAALIAGGGWSDGARCGARAVGCHGYPWFVSTSIGARGACDSL